MKRTVLMIAVFCLAGCLSAGKKEDLKEMPVAQVTPQKSDRLLPMKELPVTQMAEEVKQREKYFSLSVTNMELRNVLFVLAKELPEYNMVVDPDVSGGVTVSFRDLPLEKALDTLLDPLGLEYAIEDNVLRVSKPRMVSRTFEFVYTTSSRTSRSSLLAMTGSTGGKESIKEQADIAASYGYVAAVESVDVWAELEAGIKDIMSGSGSLSMNKRVGYITVTHYRPILERVGDFIAFFEESVKTQIHIRAKLIEVTLSKGSEFGINWGATLKQIGFLSGKSNPLTLTQDFAPGLGQTTGPTGATRPDPIAELFRIGVNHESLNLVIRALQSQGNVSVLSAPEVSILNGQKAVIRSVREDVVFQTQQSSSGSTNPISSTSAEPFTFGVYLDVIPHVDGEGMITLDVHPSVSSFVDRRDSLDKTAQRPVIDTRETQTVVTIQDGETIVIAGLMKNDTKADISKVPLLGDIPYLGKAFRKEIKSDTKTELVILITPTIVGHRAKDYGSIREKYRMIKDKFP